VRLDKIYWRRSICSTRGRCSYVRAKKYRTQELQLTPWSRVLLEKLTGLQLATKLPAFYGTRRFITAFTTARHLPLSWAIWIQSMPPPRCLKIHFNISSHLCLGLQVVSFPQVSPPESCMHLSPTPYVLHAQPISLIIININDYLWPTSTLSFLIITTGRIKLRVYFSLYSIKKVSAPPPLATYRMVTGGCHTGRKAVEA
jgi:hypothetical protein